MCEIIEYIGVQTTLLILILVLKSLEYCGYDLSGIASNNPQSAR